jgi:hypothetical protein
LVAWSVFHPSPHIWQGLRGVFTFFQAKQGVGRLNNNSLGVKERGGGVKTDGVYLQRIIRKAFVSYIEPSEKYVQIGLLLAKKK